MLHFPPGYDYVYVNIDINDDEIVENDEEFQLSLSNPVNGILGNPNIAKVVIVDDDVENTGGGAGMPYIPVVFISFFSLIISLPLHLK